MAKLALILSLLLLAAGSQAQTSNANTTAQAPTASQSNPAQKPDDSRLFKSDDWFFTWGYNKTHFSDSNINVSQPSLGNNFTVNGVQGHDEYHFPTCCSPDNLRLGRYLDEAKTMALDLSLDHTKFTSTIGQVANVTGTNNADSIRGDAKANLLLSGGGNDTISGAGGDDTIAGGAGADTISLGSGRDTVVFNRASEGGDLIIDFHGREDHIAFSASGFGVNPGVLPASEFAANRAGLANRAEAQFVYDTDGGQLYFDADGTGAGQSVLLATFQGAPMLTMSDLMLIA